MPLAAGTATSGTVTAIEVADAFVTFATASPKRTVLSEAEPSKPLPLMVIVEPTSALGGVTEERTGGGWRDCEYM